MGWNGSNEVKTPQRQKRNIYRKNSFLWIVLSICTVGILLLGVLVYMSSSTDITEENEVRYKTKKKVKGDNNRKQREPQKIVATPSNTVISHQSIKKPSYKVVSCVTNSTGMIIEKRTDADGKKYTAMIPKKSIFVHASDRVLSMVLSEDGGAMPPMPTGNAEDLEKSFVESLKTPILINDDDPGYVKKAKERVILARQEMNELMKGGLGFNEALAEHQRIQREDANLREELRIEVNTVAKKDGIGVAKEFCSQINAKLDEMGVRRISEPMTLEEMEEKIIDDLQKTREIKK